MSPRKIFVAFNAFILKEKKIQFKVTEIIRTYIVSKSKRGRDMWLQGSWIQCPSDVRKDLRSSGFYSALPWELASPHVSACQHHKLTTVHDPKGTPYKPDHRGSQKTICLVSYYSRKLSQKSFKRQRSLFSAYHYISLVAYLSQNQF